MKNVTAEVTKNEAPKQPVNGSETPLKRICGELGIEPKAARRKLRKYWRSENSTIVHNIRDRWTGDELRAILAPTKQ
jgi:hypothetical protein